MRVNVTYTAELDEVPREVFKLLRDVAEELQGPSAQTLITSEPALTEDPIGSAQSVADGVVAVRRRLAQLDTRLGDTLSIYAGYHETKLNPPAAEAAAEEAIAAAAAAVYESSELAAELEEQVSEDAAAADGEDV